MNARMLRLGLAFAALLALAVGIGVSGFAQDRGAAPAGGAGGGQSAEASHAEVAALIERLAAVAKDISECSKASREDAKLKAASEKLNAIVDRLEKLGLKDEMQRAAKGVNQPEAVGILRSIVTAQELFREGDKDGNGAHDYADSLDKLGRAGLVNVEVAAGKKGGYLFKVVGADQFRWRATAVPEVPGKTGDHGFFVNESGVIRFTTDGSAPTEASPPLGG